jgi:hypothetical protein
LNQSGFDITALHSRARIGPGMLRYANPPITSLSGGVPLLSGPDLSRKLLDALAVRCRYQK